MGVQDEALPLHGRAVLHEGVALEDIEAGARGVPEGHREGRGSCAQGSCPKSLKHWRARRPLEVGTSCPRLKARTHLPRRRATFELALPTASLCDASTNRLLLQC